MFFFKGGLSKTVYQKKSEPPFFAGSRSGVTAAFAKSRVEEKERARPWRLEALLGQMRRFNIHSVAHACSQTFLSSFTDDVLTRRFDEIDKHAGVQSCVRKQNRRQKDGGHT